ncbi:MAG TPA: TonB-dependent receptor [Pseudidiomarina sp.]|nr:TonB-dependent receptor [Pseudidiomarina sp.]
MKSTTHRLSYLSCCTLLALGAEALTMNIGYAAPQAQTITTTVRYDIPAQPTSATLLEVAEQANVQIIFTPQATRGQNSPMVSGNLTPLAAIQQALAGTELAVEQQGSGTFVVTRIQQQSSNRVQQSFDDSLGNADEERTEDVERIQVVGSNIVGARAAGNLPVTILNAEDIANTGAVTGDELLRSIPQVGDISFNNERTIGGVNDARGDVASINLRGIGTGNTLTLLNGRRLVLHPGTQTESFVPVTTVNSNTLPVAGLRRLEVLRDGAAAIYGTDAVAGVINYVLKDNVEQSNLNVTYGASEGTSLDQLNINGSTGFAFNDDKGHLTLSAALYSRSELPANERYYSRSKDLRDARGIPADFLGDSQLRNTSLSSPWGIFETDSLGTFHVQPNTMSGCVVQIDDQVCADQGSLSENMRYDPSLEDQSMTSAVDRINVFAHMTHEVTDSMEFFGEALYYKADSKRRREQNANLTAQRFTINADAAYNPFGEEVLLRNYRPVDVGPRRIEVEDTSYRLLAGLRGFSGMWDWESAVLYSRADTLDMAYNRVDLNAFRAAINATDPAVAYNPFLGGDPANLTTGVSRRNDAAVIAGIVTNVSRESESELALWDFRISNPAIVSWYAGDVGLAAGVEFRHEGYADDRDPLLDGSTPFVDSATGEILNDSSVQGSSATPDSSGSRNVASAYAEVLVPLYHNVDMQLALRHERFSDVGSVTKPKIALSWLPSDSVQLRAAYSGGFRAPNLPQVVEQGVTRSNTRDDPVTGERYSIAEVRGGNATLEPEESETLSYGIAFAPTTHLLVTIDWWHIEQNGVVGILNSQTHLLYDSLLRSQGSRNEAVIRNDELEVVYVENTYNNLDVREIAGMDISVNYDLDTNVGRFDFGINAANLRKFVQTPDPISQIVLDAQAAGNPAVPIDISVVGAGDLLAQNGNPEWRGNASVNWRWNQWGAGLRYNYVHDFMETSVTDSEGNMMPIQNWETADMYVDYRFSSGVLDNSRLRFGIRNIADKAPPTADESFGYFSNVHSNRGRYYYASWSWTF